MTELETGQEVGVPSQRTDRAQPRIQIVAGRTVYLGTVQLVLRAVSVADMEGQLAKLRRANVKLPVSTKNGPHLHRGYGRHVPPRPTGNLQLILREDVRADRERHGVLANEAVRAEREMDGVAGIIIGGGQPGGDGRDRAVGAPKLIGAGQSPGPAAHLTCQHEPGGTTRSQAHTRRLETERRRGQDTKRVQLLPVQFRGAGR